MGLTVTTARACRIVGISYRQLDYWIRSAILSIEVDSQSKRRKLDFSDLMQLKVIKSLIDRGVSLQRIREGIHFLKQELNLEKPLRDATLITDGQDIFAICRQDEEIINIVRKGQAVFGLALGDIYDELKGEVLRMYPDFKIEETYLPNERGEVG
jgi:DNA-binding transcriptional MerR regulator